MAEHGDAHSSAVNGEGSDFHERLVMEARSIVTGEPDLIANTGGCSFSLRNDIFLFLLFSECRLCHSRVSQRAEKELGELDWLLLHAQRRSRPRPVPRSTISATLFLLLPLCSIALTPLL